MRLIEINRNTYNADQFVALEKIELSDCGPVNWSSPERPCNLVVSFSGGVKVVLPTNEEERILKLIRGA